MIINGYQINRKYYQTLHFATRADPEANNLTIKFTSSS